jgi:hypothetical protein
VASAIGSIIGPLVASTLMAHLGAPALFLYTAIVHAALLGYIAFRLRMRAAPADTVKTEFNRSAAVPGGGAIAPEPLDPDHPDVATPTTVEAPAGAAQ